MQFEIEGLGYAAYLESFEQHGGVVEEGTGRLKAGTEVIVKVLRPGIERAFRKDIDAFYFAARVIERFAPGARRLRPMEVVEHFDGVVRGELDLRLESAAASEFSANTKDDTGFQLPPIKWNYSARIILTIPNQKIKFYL